MWSCFSAASVRFGVRRDLPSAGRAVLTQLRGLVRRGDGPPRVVSIHTVVRVVKLWTVSVRHPIPSARGGLWQPLQGRRCSTLLLVSRPLLRRVAVLTSFVVLPQALPCQDNSCSCLISLPHSRSTSPSRFSLPFLPLASLSVTCLFPAHPSGQGSLRHLSTCLALAVPFTYNL